MAKKTSNSPSYRDIISSLKKKQFAPVYILMGEEPYYIDSIASAIEEKAIPEEDRDFNCEVFFGADSDVASVAGAAQQFPVMAERKLVMLKEAQSMTQAKQQLEKLAPYVEKPNATTILVVTFKGDSLNATSALMKAAAKSGAVVFKSPQVKDYMLSAPVRDYCTAAGVGIDDKAVEMLCDYIGSPLSKLFGEIDKLVIAIGERKRITPKDIEDNIGISKDFNNFELKSALSERNYPKAVMIVDYFKKNPKQNPTVLTTSVLFDYFAKLCIALFSSDKSEGALMKALEMKNSYALKDIYTGMRNFNATQAVNAVHAIRDFDARSKGIGSLQNEYDLLGELIFRILT